jgi:uncharacterized protein
MIGTTPHERAYIGPFFLFLVFLLFTDLVGKFDAFTGHWAVSSSKYWVFPLQTVVCGFAVWHWRRLVTLGPWRGLCLATLAGVISLVVWVAPQAWLGAAPRTAGFDPAFFGSDGFPYWANVGARLFRMVVIVPLVEEIFWRGFLLRFFVKDEFQNVPFGTFTWKSFGIVSVAFCFEHQMLDWPGALITSVLFNLVAYRTRSLAACVVAHAVTNLGLGIYILRTGQHGFW